MAKEKDPGLQHIMKLNIRAVREPKGIYNELSKKYGQNKAREIMDDLYGTVRKVGYKSFYERKDADYDIAMIFSGCYDADIVRKACNWIYDHQNAFGDEILEIGCDCGFMTTFLGSLFQDKHITAIDRNQFGIDIAKRNVEKYGLTNVEFICADVTELKGKTYDTVFSMRTMQENGQSGEIEDLSNELITQASIYTEDKQDYANSLSSLVKDSGTFVSIERLGRNALFLAWLQALTDAGLKVDLESYSELSCMEVGDTPTFETMVFSKTDCSDVNVFMSFMSCVADCIDITLPMFEGWDAKIMYEFTRGKMIDGIELLDTITGAKSRAICCLHKQDDTCILWYSNNNGNVHLEYHDIEQKDECIEQIKNTIEEAKKLNYIKITRLGE
ncbi:class I SAM-dependent methyltransferase [Butyrivibrio sp. XBB1001]|uniref:class I SAM-dependent methyltransferase n=1 Tax=Butyrivibrio sp. XBB1001 TaxID=1280682 RepID=UPI00041B751F|nr:class I SAM-dependent methyltransferase [Butyrivibrio sp. XBB1001]